MCLKYQYKVSKESFTMQDLGKHRKMTPPPKFLILDKKRSKFGLNEVLVPNVSYYGSSDFVEWGCNLIEQ